MAMAMAMAMAWASAARADINVGVTLSITGLAASLGIPEQNTVALLPKTISGHKVNCLVLDDRSDTVTATSHARRLVAESKVDVIMGSNHHAELAGDDRRGGRGADADDLAGRVGAEHRPDLPIEHVDVELEEVTHERPAADEVQQLAHRVFGVQPLRHITLAQPELRSIKTTDSVVPAEVPAM